MRTRHLPLLGAGLTALTLAAACGGGTKTAEDTSAGEMAGMEGMQEVERMQGMPDAPAPLRVTPEQAARMGLVWGEVETAPLVRTVRTAALLKYPESEMVWVSPKVSGWVERLHARFEGQAVRAGQPLLEIYSPELVSAQEELLLARRLQEELAGGRASPSGEDLLATARQRLAFWDISHDQIDRLLETGEVRKTLTLHAPWTGVVMRKEVFEGQAVRAGDNLLMIAPADPVWIEAAVFERDIPFLSEGQPARIRVQGLPGRELRGRVAFLYPELGERTRTLRARIEVPNPGGELRPGMYAVVELESRTDDVLSLPRDAVLHSGTRQLVFVDEGGGRILPVEVRTGREGDERMELLEGPEAGRRVVLSAQYLLDSEANIMEAMRAMMAIMGTLEMEMEMPMDDMDDMEMDMPDMEMEPTGDRDGPQGRR